MLLLSGPDKMVMMIVTSGLLGFHVKHNKILLYWFSLSLVANPIGGIIYHDNMKQQATAYHFMVLEQF